MVPTGFSPEPLLAGDGDGYIAFSTNQVVTLQLMGMVEGKDFFFVTFDQMGFLNYNDMMVVTRPWLNANRPALVGYFKALIEADAINEKDPAAAAKLVIDKYGANLGLDLKQQTQQNQLQLAMVRPGGILSSRSTMSIQSWSPGQCTTPPRQPAERICPTPRKSSIPRPLPTRWRPQERADATRELARDGLELLVIQRSARIKCRAPNRTQERVAGMTNAEFALSAQRSWAIEVEGVEKALSSTAAAGWLHLMVSTSGLRRARSFPAGHSWRPPDRRGNTASSTEWVTRSVVMRCSLQMRCSSTFMCRRVTASSAPNGSSSNSRAGFSTRARAIEARWRMPPESRLGLASSKPRRPTSFSSDETRSRSTGRPATL